MEDGLKKRLAISIISSISALFILLILIPSPVAAHNPTDIEMTHHPWGGFEVVVHHRVNDTTTHYIEKIIIDVDGNHYWTEYFTQQGSKYYQYYKTDVGASSGSVITVTAVCNQDGNFTKSFSAVNFGSNTDYTIPGFYGLGVFGILFFIVLGFIIKRKIN